MGNELSVEHVSKTATAILADYKIVRYIPGYLNWSDKYFPSITATDSIESYLKTKEL